MDGVTVAFGIEIPSTSPVFLSVVALHVLTGLAAVITGAVAIFSKKLRGQHSRFGTYYFGAVIATVATAALLTAMRFVENLDVMALGLLCLGAAIFGREAMRRRWRGWVPLHITAMGSSYIFLLTAFYVENGEDLPLWDRLPHVAYWFIPAAVGVPIILLVLRFHPLASRLSKHNPSPRGSKCIIVTRIRR